MADRWHLWHNLGEAAERMVARHQRCLDAAITVTDVEQPTGKAGHNGPPAPDPATPRTGRIAERTRQRHAAIHQLLAEGNSVRAIAAKLDLARNTVRPVRPRRQPGGIAGP